MRITHDIETLELKALNLNGAWSVINPVLIRDSGGDLLCYHGGVFNSDSHRRSDEIARQK